MPTTSQLELAICIPTFNRSEFLDKTLNTLFSQITANCEIVVSDNASTDQTECVVQKYIDLYGSQIRYFKNETNVGYDRNLDCAVSLSNARFCWLTSDDDALKPFAISTVLDAIHRDVDLILANVEYRSNEMSVLIEASGLEFEGDRIYQPDELDRLFLETRMINSYVGSIVIRRELWMARERQRYYGCNWIHVGVLFQQALPGRALVLATPLIAYRCGVSRSHACASDLVNVSAGFVFVVESSALSQTLKKKLLTTDFLSSAKLFFRWRALGCYSITDYRTMRGEPVVGDHKFAAILPLLLPGRLVNFLFILGTVLLRMKFSGLSLHLLTQSRYYYRGRRGILGMVLH